MIQLFPVPHRNPPSAAGFEPPAEVLKVLRSSCFDCHSNDTDWPWYSRVAPVSWWVVSHVERGRKDLNFSQWSALDDRARDDLRRQISFQVRGDLMPLQSYVWAHPEAALDGSEKRLLLEWAATDRSPVTEGSE